MIIQWLFILVLFGVDGNKDANPKDFPYLALSKPHKSELRQPCVIIANNWLLSSSLYMKNEYAYDIFYGITEFNAGEFPDEVVGEDAVFRNPKCKYERTDRNCLALMKVQKIDLSTQDFKTINLPRNLTYENVDIKVPTLSGNNQSQLQLGLGYFDSNCTLYKEGIILCLKANSGYEISPIIVGTPVALADDSEVVAICVVKSSPPFDEETRQYCIPIFDNIEWIMETISNHSVSNLPNSLLMMIMVMMMFVNIPYVI